MTKMLNEREIVRAGVAVFVFLGDEFLMIKRQGSHGAGAWSVPGGWMEFGETPEEAAIREVKEEVDLDITVPRALSFTNDIFEDEGKHCCTIWLAAAIKNDTAMIKEPNKISDMKWTNFKKLPRPMFSSFENFILLHHKRRFLDEIGIFHDRKGT